MKIIVGLGNPGVEYMNTRHNAGLMLVDALAKSPGFMAHGSYGWRRKKRIHVFETDGMLFVKTGDLFMNESGQIIHELKTMNYELTDLYLAHDDLDIKLGEVKIHLGKGPKIHNGVNSVEEAMGAKDFWRIRIGIDNRAGEHESLKSGENYVLEKFNEEERNILNSAIDRTIAEMF